VFDGEKLIGRLPELQISSTVFDMFGENYVGCSTDSFSRLGDARYVVAVMDVEKMN
jgi:PmbA protein